MLETYPLPVHRFSHQAMGTFFDLLIAGPESEYASQAAQAAFKEIDRLESLFSRFNPSSEISQLNRIGPGQSLRIGLETYECLTIAERVRCETGEAFDVTIGSLVEYERGDEAGSTRRSRIESLLRPLVIQTVGGFEVRRKNEEEGTLSLDLGGIGKGYALDRALALLSDWSIDNALIHSGTSTALAVGSAPGLKAGEKGWPLGVGGGWPEAGGMKRLLLENRGLSGSGKEVKGRHIIDPKKGRPADGHLAAWASHREASVSDALSTAFVVMGTDEVEDYCRRHPEVWGAVVIDPETIRVFNEMSLRIRDEA